METIINKLAEALSDGPVSLGDLRRLKNLSPLIVLKTVAQYPDLFTESPALQHGHNVPMFSLQENAETLIALLELIGTKSLSMSLAALNLKMKPTELEALVAGYPRLFMIGRQARRPILARSPDPIQVKRQAEAPDLLRRMVDSIGDSHRDSEWLAESLNTEPDYLVSLCREHADLFETETYGDERHLRHVIRLRQEPPSLGVAAQEAAPAYGPSTPLREQFPPDELAALRFKPPCPGMARARGRTFTNVEHRRRAS
jgi:hypothetical protein